MTPDAAQEEKLLTRFAAGERDAARALAETLAPRLLGLAQRMLGDRAAAEDVVQETMLRLWKIAPEWQSRGASPSAWAFRVAGNLCTDRLRKRRGAVGLDTIPEPPDPSRPAEAGLMQQARAAALDRAMARLPERQRMAVHLRHIEGLSQAQVAEAMGENVRTVESLIARGRKGLAAQLTAARDALGFEAEDRDETGG